MTGGSCDLRGHHSNGGDRPLLAARGGGGAGAGGNCPQKPAATSAAADLRVGTCIAYGRTQPAALKTLKALGSKLTRWWKENECGVNGKVRHPIYPRMCFITSTCLSSCTHQCILL